jgi:hypothetical protein
MERVAFKMKLKAWGKMESMPDRVPVQFDLYRQLSDHFGKKLNVP